LGCATGKSADLALQAERYDMVLLDRGCPGRDGIDVLRDNPQAQGPHPDSDRHRPGTRSRNR
jgi:DNA-binding response OmpR family regulator